MATALPEHFGPFDVTARIGRGGMGTVFRAVHWKTGQAVAVKALAEPLADDSSFKKRFDLEIDALRQLRHPNIVRLLGYGQEEETYYYAMELVEGHSLEEELASGRRFTWQEALAMAIQIASALHCAHAHGIVHRDLKPANLLLAADGTIKLTDFGIASLFGASSLTTAGSVIGTLNYMAPEQALSEPISTATDLFSFGAVLIALLTGKPPFSATTLPQIIHQHATMFALHPSQRGVDIPQEFDELIGRMLEKTPSRRPKNAYFISRILEAVRREMGEEALIAVADDGQNGGGLSAVVPLSTAALRQKLKEKKAKARLNAQKKDADARSSDGESGIGAERLPDGGPEGQEAQGRITSRDESGDLNELAAQNESVAQNAGLETASFGGDSLVYLADDSGTHASEMEFLGSDSFRLNAEDLSKQDFTTDAEPKNDRLAEPSDSSSASLERASASDSDFSENPSRRTWRESGQIWFESFDEENVPRDQADASLQRDSASASGAEGSATGLLTVDFSSEALRETPRSFFREEKSESAPVEKKKWRDSKFGSTFIVLLCLAVSSFIAVKTICYWALPPDADALYEEIQTAAKEERNLIGDRLTRNVDMFLTFYSTDPRAKEIRELQSEMELKRMEKKLLANTRIPHFQSLSPIERDYFSVIQTLQANPEETLRRLEDFVAYYLAVWEMKKDNPEFSQRDLAKQFQYLEIAKRQIHQIRRVLSAETAERRETLRLIVEQIQACSKSPDPDVVEKGRRLRRAALDLYEDLEPEILRGILEDAETKSSENGSSENDAKNDAESSEADFPMQTEQKTHLDVPGTAFD